MSVNEHEKIGQLVLPPADQTEEKQPNPVLLDMKDLRHLHGIMFPSVQIGKYRSIFGRIQQLLVFLNILSCLNYSFSTSLNIYQVYGIAQE